MLESINETIKATMGCRVCQSRSKKTRYEIKPIVPVLDNVKITKIVLMGLFFGACIGYLIGKSISKKKVNKTA